MKHYLLISGLLVLLSACNDKKGFTTEGGTEVIYLRKAEDGASPMADSVLLIHMKQTYDSGQVLHESGPDRPLAVAFNPELKAGELPEVVKNLKIGDSVTFELSAANLYLETYGRPVPAHLDPAQRITVNMCLAHQMSMGRWQLEDRRLRRSLDSIQMAKEQKSLAGQLQIDGDSIDAWLATKNIDPITTESGLRYVVEEEGTGPIANRGDVVSVHYTGTLMDGTLFDTSKKRGEPLSFQVGEFEVIPGWDEAVQYLKEGSKARLYIPSPLGYGRRAAGPSIPPYSILIFDVEIVEVQKKDEVNQ